MKYKGSIGEFKPLSFVIWIFVWVAFALFIYFQLTFVREEPPKDQKTTADLLQHIGGLDSKIEVLQQQLKTISAEVEQLKQRKCR